MLMSTTSIIEGKKIKEYRGIVFGEVVNGVNFTKDFLASITNFVGGRSKEYEEEIVNARADAVKEMMDRAKKIGANGLVGIKIDVETISVNENGVMLLVVATGTAVVVED